MNQFVMRKRLKTKTSFQTLSSDCSQEALSRAWRTSAPSISWLTECLTSSITSVRTCCSSDHTNTHPGAVITLHQLKAFTAGPCELTVFF